MRRLALLFVALGCFHTSQAFAQNVPARFHPLAKNDGFRLLRVLGQPEIPPTFEAQASFSADGRFAIYAEDLSHPSDAKDAKKDKVELRLRTRLLLWDLQSKRWPREIDVPGRSVTALQLNADGSKVVLAGERNVGAENKPLPYVSLWDLSAGKELHFVAAGESAKQILCLALSPDEASALAGDGDGVQHWDLKQGKLLGAYVVGKKGFCAAVAFLPGGKQFLAGYGGGQIRLWEIGKNESLRTFSAKADPEKLVWHLAVSADGKRLASSDGRSVTLWDIFTGKAINTFRRGESPIESIVTAVVLADDGKTVLSSWIRAPFDPDDYYAARLEAWDGEANKTLWSKQASHRGRVPLRLKGDTLLVGGGPNLFEAWSIKDGKQLDSWGGHKGSVNALAVLPNGDILSAGQEGTLMTWRQGQVVARRSAHHGPIGVLTLTPDRKHWFTGGIEPAIKRWSAGADAPTLFKGHTGPIASFVVSKDGRWGVSGSGDRSVKTWDVMTGKEIATITGHADAVSAVALSPDQLWLASASDDTTIRVWPIKDGKLDPDRETVLLEGHKKAVTCLAFSPDGKTLLSGSQDQTMKAWDWANEKIMRTIPGHKNWISSVQFLDPNTILTTSDDLSICQWELDSGKEIGRIDFGPVGDCPRCVTRLGADRLLVGTSSWLIYEFQILPQGKSKAGAGSSK